MLDKEQFVLPIASPVFILGSLIFFSPVVIVRDYDHDQHIIPIIAFDLCSYKREKLDREIIGMNVEQLCT